MIPLGDRIAHVLMAVALLAFLIVSLRGAPSDTPFFRPCGDDIYVGRSCMTIDGFVYAPAVAP